MYNMNEFSSSSGGVRDVDEAKSKTITPAVLGMVKSHGMKLELNMTSQDKKELLSKLEEWRKVRKEKLAASILAKQKQIEKPKTSISVVPGKTKIAKTTESDGKIKSQEKESVFERLYKNSQKIKKQDGNAYSSGSSQIKEQALQKPNALKSCKLFKSCSNLQGQQLEKENGNLQINTCSDISDIEHTTANTINMIEDKIKTKTEIQVEIHNETLTDEKPNREFFQNKDFIEESRETKTIKKTQVMTPFEAKSTDSKSAEIVGELQETVNSGNVTKNGETLNIMTEIETINCVGISCKKADGEKIIKDPCPKINNDNIEGNKTLTQKKPIHSISLKEKNCTQSNFCGLRVIPTEIPVQISGNEKPKNLLRRSISMMYRQKSKTVGKLSHKTLSLNNLNELKSSMNGGNLKIISPANKTSGLKGKSACNNKSVSIGAPKSYKSFTSNCLRAKLEDWLTVHGHSLEGYKHLRCFGISNPAQSLLKPVTTVNSRETPSCSEAPKNLMDDSDKENLTPPTVTHQMQLHDVENWLKELHRLIVELKYPSERCEEWLSAIRKKCAECTQMPIYWECLAALHESSGDIKSAIEDYEKAIIKGGEVDSVSNSLEQLFDKMVIKEKKPSKARLEKGLDLKNIFKSTIIKFAVQQKALKELGSKIEPGAQQHLLIATPVRRSSRIQTPLKSDVVTSLQSLTPEVRRNIKFKPNESLLSGE